MPRLLPALPLTDMEKQELLTERKETVELYRRLIASEKNPGQNSGPS